MPLDPRIERRIIKPERKPDCTQLLAMADMILARLDLEAKERGPEAVFMFAAIREDLRDAIAQARPN